VAQFFLTHSVVRLVGCGLNFLLSASQTDLTVIASLSAGEIDRCPPDSPNPDSPKPISPNLEKVHSMSKSSCFAEKIVRRIFNYVFSPNFLLSGFGESGLNR